MARILVNIIGGQTQPNILLAKEIHHQMGQIDQLVLVYTNFTKKQFERTKLACAELGTTVIPVEVIEDDIIDIQTKLTQAVTIEDEDELFVNITGGTKIMSIGVYDFFVKYSARILYVVLGKNTYHQVFPRVKNRVNEFHYALNLEEYLTGYGVVISNPNGIHKLTKSQDSTFSFFEKAKFFEQGDWEMLDLIRQGYRGKKMVMSRDKTYEENENISKIFDFLREKEFAFDKADELNKSETKYLTGDWFEEYVYSQLKSIVNIDDNYWGMGLQIKIDNAGADDVPNEIDFALMLKNELHIIECKTRLITTDGSNIITETLYKVDSLRTKFGLNVKAFLFTLAGEEEVKKGIPRGNLNNITIVSLNQIQDKDKLSALFKK